MHPPDLNSPGGFNWPWHCPTSCPAAVEAGVGGGGAWLHSWCRVGRPLLKGGQGLWQPRGRWRRFPQPCASQAAAGQAELSSGGWTGEQAAGNPVDPEAGQALVSVGVSVENPPGTDEPPPGVST